MPFQHCQFCNVPDVTLLFPAVILPSLLRHLQYKVWKDFSPILCHWHETTSTGDFQLHICTFKKKKKIRTKPVWSTVYTELSKFNHNTHWLEPTALQWTLPALAVTQSSATLAFLFFLFLIYYFRLCDINRLLICREISFAWDMILYCKQHLE